MNTSLGREEELFDAARQLSEPAQRAAFLDAACKGETTLRARVETLLAAHEEADRFFEESSSILGTLDTSGRLARGSTGSSDLRRGVATGEEPVGTRIGRYKLVEKVGEGGCGIVYLAEQEEPVRRQVALKIIRLGMESRNVIVRFEAERQALAMMDHPNIARVFDAGETERGSPYFVMEYVRGVRITSYCDQNRLNLRERLDLFIQICHAIQHAHQKGIIHGDIKPSNIMVAAHDGVPVPKVIDFGISKATEARLTDRVPFAPSALVAGTPAYMSPEQMEMGGLDVDTRSDIYSLGVLYYELLTGRTPFEVKQTLEAAFEEMRVIFHEREVERPSARLHALAPGDLARVAAARRMSGVRLISAMKGDLDWIAAKALQKDRRRRYETANGLALDIHRHLECEPVTAHPPGWLYRMQKVGRRNRGAFITAGAVAAALVIGTGVSTWLFLKEREARQRAVAAEQQQVQLRFEAETREKITQAALLISQERFDEVDELLRGVGVTRATLETAAVFRSMGEWHAINGRWRQAADRFEVLLRVNQLDGLDVSTLDYLELGPVLAELGDTARFERFRQDAITRFDPATCPFADRIVKISLLLPAGEGTVRSLGSWTESTVKAFQQADTAEEYFQAAWRSVSLGLYDYRRGNYSGAADWCRRCLNYPESNAPRTATARIILAMACQQLGRFAEARTELEAGREVMENKLRVRQDRGTPMQGFWFDWAFARILLREAEALIGSPPRQG